MTPPFLFAVIRASAVFRMTTKNLFRRSRSSRSPRLLNASDTKAEFLFSSVVGPKTAVHCNKVAGLRGAEATARPANAGTLTVYRLTALRLSSSSLLSVASAFAALRMTGGPLCSATSGTKKYPPHKAEGIAENDERDYSSKRISRILIAAVAIGVPGPKMAAAPSR